MVPCGNRSKQPMYESGRGQNESGRGFTKVGRALQKWEGPNGVMGEGLHESGRGQME